MSSLVAVALAWAGVTARVGAAEPAMTPPPAAGATATPVAGSGAQAERAPVADPVEVAADALVVRPVGLAATVVGAAIYVVALPFAAIAGDVHGPARSLVGAPARFTFKRRLGDFEARPF